LSKIEHQALRRASGTEIIMLAFAERSVALNTLSR